MNVNIVTVGDEILIGQIIDTNSAWMGQQLNLVGAKVSAIHSVSDTKEGIINALEIGLKQADVVLLTGGLSPTKDDITKNTIALIILGQRWYSMNQLGNEFKGYLNVGGEALRQLIKNNVLCLQVLKFCLTKWGRHLVCGLK